jgi:hypothetical protein
MKISRHSRVVIYYFVINLQNVFQWDTKGGMQGKDDKPVCILKLTSLFWNVGFERIGLISFQNCWKLGKISFEEEAGPTALRNNEYDRKYDRIDFKNTDTFNRYLP